MIDAQAISDALGGRKYGKDYRSACPVCGGSDKATKFSMTDDGDKVLVHCHAGCSFADIVAELRNRGLWPDATPAQLEVARRNARARDIEHEITILMLAESDREQGRDLSPKDKKTVEQAQTKVAMATPFSGFANTDMANGERFAALCRDYVFYTPERGWMIWDGKHWRVDEANQIMRLAKLTAKKIFSELEDSVSSEQTDLFNWARRSQSKDRLKAMIELAISEPGIAASLTDFDADPMVLNVNNGTIDLKTGELKPHDSEQKLSKITQIDYDPAAKCPLWLSFLSSVMDDNDEMIDFLQRAVGYTLTGDTGEQCLFFPHGVGANGKSVFLETLLRLLGDYGTNTRAETIMAKNYSGIPNDIARLVGKRFVGISETECGQKMAESLVKDLTGGDTVTARFLRKEFFDFKPEFKLWIRGNHKPNVRGTDDGIWRRIHLIPFDVQIPEAERDSALPGKLREELPGILRWAVDGTLALQKDGLRVPEKVRAATSEYRDEMDRLSDFIAERCVKGAGLSAYAGTLFKEYQEWCGDSGEHAMTQTAFGLSLGERGYVKKTTGGRKKYMGIGLGATNKESRAYG